MNRENALSKESLINHAKLFWNMLKQTAKEWQDDQAPRLGAALAYYTVFSLGPLLIIIIAIVGLVYGEQAAAGRIEDQITGLVGPQSASAIQAMIQGASHPTSGIIATIIGVISLLVGASGVFGELQYSLNAVWDLPPKPKQGFMAAIKDRFLSFSMVLGSGFLLLVSLVLSAGLTAAGSYLNNRIPGISTILPVVDIIVSLGIITFLFALIFKFLPDVDIEWRDVWVGAAITAVLFTIGKFAIGMYLGRSAFASTYGAAGSIMIVLLWTYYSAQILFFGAEFTQVYGNNYGSRVVKGSEHTEAEQAQDSKGSPPAEPHREVSGLVGAKGGEVVASEQRPSAMQRLSLLVVAVLSLVVWKSNQGK